MFKAAPAGRGPDLASTSPRPVPGPVQVGSQEPLDKRRTTLPSAALTGDLLFDTSVRGQPSAIRPFGPAGESFDSTNRLRFTGYRRIYLQLFANTQAGSEVCRQYASPGSKPGYPHTHRVTGASQGALPVRLLPYFIARSNSPGRRFGVARTENRRRASHRAAKL